MLGSLSWKKKKRLCYLAGAEKEANVVKNSQAGGRMSPQCSWQYPVSPSTPCWVNLEPPVSHHPPKPAVFTWCPLSRSLLNTGS